MSITDSGEYLVVEILNAATHMGRWTDHYSQLPVSTDIIFISVSADGFV
jgi:hypothetical protein